VSISVHSRLFFSRFRMLPWFRLRCAKPIGGCVLVAAIWVMCVSGSHGQMWMIGGGKMAIHEHSGGKEIPSAPYVRVVPEKESPVCPLYIKTKDGLYVAAALRKPKGDGPFPVVIFLHGFPGGRGMDELTGWCLGTSGSPLLERFLKEGFVVVAADYRGGGTLETALQPIPEHGITALDDCLAVWDHIRSLPFVDASRIHLYGSSYGANLAAHLAGRRDARSVVMGGGVILGLLGATPPRLVPGVDKKKAFLHLPVDPKLARRNVEAIRCPVLLLVGGDDFLADINRQFYDLMIQAGKPIQLELYNGAYHGFETGPGAMAGPGAGMPLLEGSLDALNRAVAFLKERSS
jgi:dipeptidyl aminopeptidase/acylaminoacyl peptidase